MLLKRTLISTALSAAVAGMAAPALSQIEEVVVTARKAQESLQSTPVAVTALSEEMLIKAQVTKIDDLRRSAPSLSIMSGGTGSSALIFLSIRGNAQVSPSGGTDPAVATYVDGVYLARPTGGNVDMFDVSQAEVLRGPQGTLFGRNTTGGALNIKTNDPTGEFGGYGKIEIGNYEHRRFEGVLNVPIMGEELGARFAVRYNERDGYGDYVGYSDPNGFVWNGLDQEAAAVEENTYVRAKLQWQPLDRNFTATLGLDWSEYEDSGQRSQVVGINPGAAGGLVGAIFSGNAAFGIPNGIGFDPQAFLAQQDQEDTYWNADRSSLNTVPPDSRLADPESTNENKGAYLTLDFDLGGSLALKSITAYREATSTGTVDLDGLPVSLLTFHSEWDQEQWSQEFQLSGSVNDDLDWITGLYYFTEDSGDFSVNRFGRDFASALIQSGAPVTGVPLELIAPFMALSTNDAVHENISYGAFAQANYSFTEKLRGTLGFRYTWDERETRIFSENPESGQLVPAQCKIEAADRDIPGGPCERTQNAKFEYPAWVVSLDYQYSDNLFLYAKTSGASMAGGWNFRSSSNPSFDPEQVKDVEVGFKSDLFDGRVRFNGAFFYMKATDQQRLINIAVDNQPVQFIRNAGKSQTEGAEFELTWLPWDGMNINASVSILDVEYEKYSSLELVTSGPNAGDLVTVDRSDENPVHAPELTYSIAATQTFYTDLGELDLHVDYYWVDETWFQDNTVNPFESAAVQANQREEQQWNSVPEYDLINARATLRSNDGHWEFSLWGKNLADEEYYTSVANFWNAFGTALRYNGAPRTYGASVKYNW